MAARHSTSEPPVTTITRRTKATPLFEDQIRSYRQGQRRRYNAQRTLQRVARQITRKSPHNQTLEQQMDPQVQLRLSMQERASIVPAEVLYHSRNCLFLSWLAVMKIDSMVTRGLLGRLSNTPNVGFTYEVENVVDYLANHGVRALPGRRYSTRDVLGQNWIIRQSIINIPMQPTEVNTRNLLDGSVSLHFESYQAASASTPPRYNSRDKEVQSDEDELRTHVVAVLIKEAPLLVKKVYPDALLPERKTIGAAGYDLSVYKSQMIPAKGMTILHTGNHYWSPYYSLPFKPYGLAYFGYTFKKISVIEGWE
ncbi:hypothetical protein ZIOFF_022933 [Zingiber officinale]|uniref:Uncharacterized protein n=1 Tax=Zingiber officinale TaxID=94328 RepID=A0A8J5LN33_ZINOF|nr:hypothetical protein ZIOFF_022933 [Zingiber officinale]